MTMAEVEKATIEAMTHNVVLLNDDAVVEPGFLDALVAAVERRPTIGVVGALAPRMSERLGTHQLTALALGCVGVGRGRAARNAIRDKRFEVVHAHDTRRRRPRGKPGNRSRPTVPGTGHRPTAPRRC